MQSRSFILLIIVTFIDIVCIRPRHQAAAHSLAEATESNTATGSFLHHHSTMSASNTAGRAARQLLRSSTQSAGTRASTSALTPTKASQRTVSSSAPRTSFLSNITDRLAKVALGQNFTETRKRGGILPEEQNRLEYERRRDSAMASVSPDGTPLFDDVESLPISQQAERKQQRISAKIEARQLRKRFNAKDPVTGEALEHKYSTAAFKISPRKLQMLANQISGQPIDYAILQMQFSPKRAAKRVLSTLALARDHAAAKGMEVPRLVVSEAWVGKGIYLTRTDIKGRARMGRKHHPQARLSVVLRYGKTYAEKETEKIALARKRVRAIGTGGVVRTDQKVVNQFQRPGWGW